jgi:hypothetical protein
MEGKNEKVTVSINSLIDKLIVINTSGEMNTAEIEKKVTAALTNALKLVGGDHQDQSQENRKSD